MGEIGDRESDNLPNQRSHLASEMRDHSLKIRYHPNNDRTPPTPSTKHT